jgi:hypothetical protein
LAPTLPLLLEVLEDDIEINMVRSERGLNGFINLEDGHASTSGLKDKRF